jgi:outer membrane cobalamin receptor
VFFSVLFCISTLSHAIGTANELFELPLSDLANVKVKGSTLTPHQLRDTPSAITIFSREQISRIGVNTLDELIGLVPGFQSYRQGEQGNHQAISSRGRRTGGAGVSEILIMLDGHRVSEAGNDGSATIMPSIPLFNIKSIEFIRGPGSAIYGSNAMMGVINIVTVNHVNEAKVSYGSFDKKTTELLLSQRLGAADVELFARYEDSNGDDYTVLSGGTSNSFVKTDDPETNKDLHLKASLANSKLSWIHTDRDSKNFYVLDSLANETNRVESYFDSVSISHLINWADVDTTFSVYANQTQLKIRNIFGPSELMSDLNSEEKRATIGNNWRIDDSRSVQFGAEYRNTKVTDATASNSVGTLTLVEPEQQRIFGLYGQYQHAISTQTQLNLGLRYDDYSLVGSNLSPRLGIVHHLNDNHTFKLLYGEAFRAPSHAELGLTNNPVVKGNPDLAAETVETIDLIWLGQWQQTLISIGYFENHFDQAITLSSNVPATYVNSPQDPSKGLELELIQDISTNWQLQASLTHLSSKPEEAIREADNVASLTINYHATQWNFNMAAEFTDNREMLFGGRNPSKQRLSSYWLLRSKFQYAIDSQWTLSLEGNNLLDQDYETPPQSGNLTNGIPNKGTDIQASVQYSF